RPGSPLWSSPRTTLWKVTVPDGNNETDMSPRSTGSSPVTAWISLATASRTLLAGMKNDSATKLMTTAAITAPTAIARRFKPVAAVTGCVPRFACADRIDGWAGDASTCPASVSLSWPRSPRYRPKGWHITTNSTGRVWVAVPGGYPKDCARDGNYGCRSTGKRPAKRFGLSHLGDHFLNDGLAERIEALRRHDEG